MIFAMAFAVLGGKGLFAITQMSHPEIPFIMRFNGFVFYGGLIGALIGLFVYTRVYGGRFFGLSDVFVSLLPLGQAVGRIGCYFNGCCYGKEYNGFLAVNFLLDYEYVRVFPTWFVEAGFCILIFLFFFAISERKNCGFYTGTYMILYSTLRFLIEFYRGDTIRGVRSGISTSQNISILVFFGGIGSMIYSNVKRDKNIMIVDRRKQSYADKCFSKDYKGTKRKRNKRTD